MKKNKFHTISLQQLYDFMKDGIELPKNPVVLTFDDGYLDNWVFAYPLLKRYGFSGTIYINPDFVFPENIRRKTLQDVWEGNVKIQNLKTTGFLSWNEMKEMIDEGVMGIQSHSMTHTLYPKSNKIIDFRHPNDPYIWMTWNNHPEKKPYLQIDNDNLINYGEPVYEYGHALNTRRYFPDDNLAKYLTNYVTEQGIDNFFMRLNWRNILLHSVELYKKEHELNEKIETYEDYKKRIKYELEKSKEIIEQKLKKDIKFICWPVGATCKEALQIAHDVGYLSSTVARDVIPDQKRNMKNQFGENPSRINRMGTSLYWNGNIGDAMKIKYRNGFLLGFSLYDFQQKKVFGTLNKILFIITHSPKESITKLVSR
jgi:hypothetical protein